MCQKTTTVYSYRINQYIFKKKIFRGKPWVFKLKYGTLSLLQYWWISTELELCALGVRKWTHRKCPGRLLCQGQATSLSDRWACSFAPWPSVFQPWKLCLRKHTGCDSHTPWPVRFPGFLWVKLFLIHKVVWPPLVCYGPSFFPPSSPQITRTPGNEGPRPTRSGLVIVSVVGYCGYMWRWGRLVAQPVWTPSWSQKLLFAQWH